MTDDYEDEEIEEQPKRKKNNARELELATLASTMKTAQGRAMLWRLLQQTSIFTPCFNMDARIHAHNSGRREYGLWLDAELLEASKELYYIMLKENR